MIKLNKNHYKVLNILGLRIEYWGNMFTDTFLSVDTKSTRYVFGIRKFKYYGTVNVSKLI